MYYKLSFITFLRKREYSGVYHFCPPLFVNTFSVLFLALLVTIDGDFRNTFTSILRLSFGVMPFIHPFNHSIPSNRYFIGNIESVISFLPRTFPPFPCRSCRQFVHNFLVAICKFSTFWDLKFYSWMPSG